MPRPRFQKADPGLQKAIVEAAAAEFAAQGYEGASVNRILDAAGMSKGGFYYYFDDKADLAATVFQWSYREIFDYVERMALPEDGAHFWDAIDDYQRFALATLRRTPQQTELVARLGVAMVRDAHLASHVQPLMAGAMARLVALWRRGQDLGVVRDDLPVEVLVAVLQGIKEGLLRALLPPGRGPTPEEFERLAGLFFDLFRRASERRDGAGGERKAGRARAGRVRSGAGGGERRARR